MRRFAVLLMIALGGTLLLPLSGAMTQSQELPERSYGKNEENVEDLLTQIIEKTRKENEELRKELLRQKEILEELKAKQLEAAEERLDKGAPEDTEAIQKGKAAEEQLKDHIEQLRFEQFQKTMEQLQLEMQKLQSQRGKLEAELSQEMARKEKDLEDLVKKIEEQQFIKALDANAGINIADLLYGMTKAPRQDSHDAEAAYNIALTRHKMSAKQQELEDAMLSKGDAGLIAMLRFEKVKLFRKLRMYDAAVQELRRIIEQNLDERVTEAARWTLVETLQEQKEKEAAIAELERLLATTDDVRKKKDALYGIINLLGDDPESKVGAIERLIRNLQGKQPEVSGSEEMPVSSLPAVEPAGIPDAPAAPSAIGR